MCLCQPWGRPWTPIPQLPFPLWVQESRPHERDRVVLLHSPTKSCPHTYPSPPLSHIARKSATTAGPVPIHTKSTIRRSWTAVAGASIWWINLAPHALYYVESHNEFIHSIRAGFEKSCWLKIVTARHRGERVLPLLVVSKAWRVSLQNHQRTLPFFV